MGINISVLTPLAAPLAVQPVTAAVLAEARPQPDKVAAAGSASQAGVQTGSGQSGAKAAEAAAQKTAPAELAAAGQMPKAGASAAQAAIQSAGDTMVEDSADAAAAMARQRLALAEAAEKRADASTAAQRYEGNSGALEQAKSFADRVGLLPEPGDLALSFSEMPPYAGREEPSPAMLTSPQAETIARA